jgi:hypothetical protein
MTNLRRVLSAGLTAATLTVVLTYVLGAQAILQTPYAEPAHELYMSTTNPLIEGITGGPASDSQQTHGGSAPEESTM